MMKKVFMSAHSDSNRIRVDAERDAQVLNFSKKKYYYDSPQFVILRTFAYFCVF